MNTIWDVLRIVVVLGCMVSLGCMIVAWRAWRKLDQSFKVLGALFAILLVAVMYGAIEGYLLELPGSPRLFVTTAVVLTCTGVLVSLVREDH